MYISNLLKDSENGGPLTAATEASLSRFAESMTPNHVKYKEAFERDFIKSKPNLSQLVQRFRLWRDNLEKLLDSRPHKFYLEHFSQYLAEFEFSKFDDIEVPGQYLSV
jgi:transformation/transcription domain-associated protein